MRRYRDGVLLSAGDLVTFLGCRHATTLHVRALDEPMDRAPDDPTLEILQARGLEHEQSYRASLAAEGRTVIDVPDGPGLTVTDRLSLTRQAMRAGADVVSRAVLMHGSWHGVADFLVKIDTPSALGAWSYEPVDTKLAANVAPRHVIRLTVNGALLAAEQGVPPHRLGVVLGSGAPHSFRTDDFLSYVRLASGRLEAFVADAPGRAASTPEPCAHCDECAWKNRCQAEWLAADHLSQVANIRRSQATKLRAAGVDTMAALAALPDGHRVPGMAAETLIKLQRQARLQTAVKGTDETRHELLARVPGKGFDRLPRPAEGDLFFDMEGDPLYPGGLEYLFGVHWMENGRDRFRPFWAHDRAAEKTAFQAFIDFVADHLSRHPDAHIYHYNHYEVTAVRRLASFHATREAVVDDLLRRRKFVDLYVIVREALQISEPRYSLKNVEHFYQGKRAGEVSTATDSIVAYERWRVVRDQRILDEIEAYNAIDCRSTAGLLGWLVSIRPDDVAWFDSAAAGPDETALSRQQEAEAERQALHDRLMTGAEADRPFRMLVHELTDFHRREKKPEWWAMFDRQTRDEEELLTDTECLCGLRLAGAPVPEAQSFVYTYRFPPQETKLTVGKKPVVIDSLKEAGTITALTLDRHTVSIKRGKRVGPLPEALDLGPPKPIDDAILRAAVRRFADAIAADDGRFRALARLLRREPPRLRGRAPAQPLVPPGVSLLDGAIAAVADLEDSHLFIQGPPGTGKTFTTSRIIVDLIRRGHRIGVSSNSHAAINNLLEGIETAAKDLGVVFHGQKKANKDDAATHFDGAFITSVFTSDDLAPSVDLLAGTAWLFANEAHEEAFDYLFVDEAGQVSLANLIAMGTAARNIVLVGDQMQLGQPIKGTHPGESGASALEILLGDEAVVPPDRGIFLDVSYRMNPTICGWISEAIYDGRLTAHPTTVRQELLIAPSGLGQGAPGLAPRGLRFVSVEHIGCGQRSLEEAEAVRALWLDLQGRSWRDRIGAIRTIGPDDIVVVAPYNVQVNLLRATLPAEARVGTVDKFQGQEAAVVIVSMTTSSGDDLPRDVEFLFSRNRINVAVSRARCLAVVVASPRLLEVSCGSLDQLRLVNTLCHAYGWSEGLDPRSRRWEAQLDEALT